MKNFQVLTNHAVASLTHLIGLVFIPQCKINPKQRARFKYTEEKCCFNWWSQQISHLIYFLSYNTEDFWSILTWLSVAKTCVQLKISDYKITKLQDYRLKGSSYRIWSFDFNILKKSLFSFFFCSVTFLISS